MNDDDAKPKAGVTRVAVIRKDDHEQPNVTLDDEKQPSLAEMCFGKPLKLPEATPLDQATLEYAADWLRRRARRWRDSSGGDFPIADATRAIAVAELIIAAELLLEGSEP